MPPQNLNAAQALPLQPLQPPITPSQSLDDYRPPPERVAEPTRGSPTMPVVTTPFVEQLPADTWQPTRAAPAPVAESAAAPSLAASSYAATQYAANTAVASSVTLERPALNTMDINEAPEPPLALADNPNSLAVKGIVLGVIFAPLGIVISWLAHKRHRTERADLLSKIGLGVSSAGLAVMALAIIALSSSFATMRDHNRDITLQNRVSAVEPEIQATFIKNGTYPTLAQLNSQSWRSVNMIGTSAAALSPEATKPALLVSAKATKHAFAYTAYPAHCSGSKVSPCTSFALATQQSSGVDYAVN